MEKAIQLRYDGSFEAKCGYAQAAGFRHVAVSLASLRGKSERECDAAIEDIQRILDDKGLSCVQTHAYYYEDMRLSSEIRKEECETAIKEAIRATGALGAAWCAIHPRTSLTTGSYQRQSLIDNQKAFGEYLECAVKYNTGIGAENLAIFAENIPTLPVFSSSYEELCTLVDSFHDPHIGICWDFGHANLMGIPQERALKEIGSRVVCTHISNNFQLFDDHASPSHGGIPWETVMPAFAATGYKGALTLEVQCAYSAPMLLQSFMRHNYECLLYLESLMQ